MREIPQALRRIWQAAKSNGERWLEFVLPALTGRPRNIASHNIEFVALIWGQAGRWGLRGLVGTRTGTRKRVAVPSEVPSKGRLCLPSTVIQSAWTPI